MQIKLYFNVMIYLTGMGAYLNKVVWNNEHLIDKSMGYNSWKSFFIYKDAYLKEFCSMGSGNFHRYDGAN